MAPPLCPSPFPFLLKWQAPQPSPKPLSQVKFIAEEKLSNRWQLPPPEGICPSYPSFWFLCAHSCLPSSHYKQMWGGFSNMEEETWWVGESLHLGFQRERETAPLFPLSQRQHKVRLSPFLECSYLFFFNPFSRLCSLLRCVLPPSNL